jgi:hypothetical protein
MAARRVGFTTAENNRSRRSINLRNAQRPRPNPRNAFNNQSMTNSLLVQQERAQQVTPAPYTPIQQVAYKVPNANMTNAPAINAPATNTPHRNRTILGFLQGRGHTRKNQRKRRLHRKRSHKRR